VTKEALLKQIKQTFEQVVDVRYIDRDFDLGKFDREKAIKFVYELVDDGELMFFGKHRYITPFRNGYIRGASTQQTRAMGFWKLMEAGFTSARKTTYL